MYYTARTSLHGIQIRYSHQEPQLDPLMSYTTEDLDDLREHLIGFLDVEADACEEALKLMLNNRRWINVEG